MDGKTLKSSLYTLFYVKVFSISSHTPCLLRYGYVCTKSLQSCLTLHGPIDCNPPVSSIHGIIQARILEWVAISFSRGLPDLGIEPGSPSLQADALPSEPPGGLP